MIVYQPCYDTYHTMLRMVRFLKYHKKQVTLDQLLIVDFYCLYPHRMISIRLNNNEEGEAKRFIKNHVSVRKENPYNRIPNDRLLFEKVKSYQLDAIRCLSSYSLIDSVKLENGTIELTSLENIDLSMFDLSESSTVEANAIRASSAYLIPMKINGKNGLKSKSRLMEFKYDI